MPVWPDSIAGCMYHVADSSMLKDLEGMATVGAKERDRILRGMEKKYMFGKISGVSGAERIGVDYVATIERTKY